MKILFPTSEFPPKGGGVASLAYEQACGLANLGEEVHVQTTANAGRLSDVPKQLAGYEAVDVRLPSIARLLPLAKHLRHARQILSPDFIYSPTYRGYGLPIRALSGSVPYAIYFHGTEIRTEVGKPARRAILQSVIRHASFLATNSHNTRSMLLSFFPDLVTPVHAIHPGVHVERFQSQEAVDAGRALRQHWLSHFGADERAVIAVAVCRMSFQKGLDHVIAAMAQMRDMPLYAVLAGDGPELEQFKAMAAAAGVADRVLFPGGVPYMDTAAYYTAADFYVQPSRPVGDFLESFGISFLEAQACGLPCIGSDWGGVPEAVDKGMSALLIPPGDVHALTAAMCHLVTDVDARRAMGEVGRARASRSSWRDHCRVLRELIMNAQEAAQSR